MLDGTTPVQRCIRHKERNVLEHLPERDRPAVRRLAGAVPGSPIESASRVIDTGRDQELRDIAELERARGG